MLGETHDNPGHHAAQADAVRRIAPRALVFEMLTPEQAVRVTPQNRQDINELAYVLSWDQGGWPDFGMYYPIFMAAPRARIFGAQVPRSEARAALNQGIEASFGPEAAKFGLTDPLPPAQQAEREALQKEAHCGALPDAMLGGMVALQRLRDAELARAALEALDRTGGPVVVITGNGHARKDWGVPAVLAHARPGVRVWSVGQDEAGEISGRFDEVWPGNPVERADPCAAFN